MKSLLLLVITLCLSACASKDLFYTAKPDIQVTIYTNSDITRKLTYYSDARYLHYYSDSELHSIMENAIGYWIDSLGYEVQIRPYGDPAGDDSSDYVIKITKYTLTEQKHNKQVSQPATTNSPKMSATVQVRQVNCSFTALMHSNLNGTDKEISSSASQEENITAGYYQPYTPLLGSSSTPSYKYICDIIPLSSNVTEYTSESAMIVLVNRIDHRIHKEFRFKLRAEKRRQKQLMKGPVN